MSFYTVIDKVIKDVEKNGYNSEEQLKMWIRLVKQAAYSQLMPEDKLQSLLDRTLRGIFARETRRVNVGIIEPELRRELSRRIAASASLIKLNREEAVEKTIRRFAGWATSGGDSPSTEIKKSLKQLPYVERRVLIDQGHKLAGNINNIIAEGSGAIAVVWHSHYRQAGYNYREDHKDRDGKVWVLRDSWAHREGLIKGEYYDTITAFNQEPFCRCYGQYIYSLRELPDDMLTAKGRSKLNV